MNIRLTQDQLRQIDDALAAGSKIEAIRLCREFSGSGLREAKEFVESRPAAAMLPPSTTSVSASRILGVLLVPAIAAAAYYALKKQTGPASPTVVPSAPTTMPAAAVARPRVQSPEIVLAASRQDLPKVRELLEAGTDVNTIAHGTEEAALIAAVGRPNDQGLELATLLIERGAEVNHQRQGGETALLRAIRNRSPKTVRLLLDRGADPNLRAPRGKSPLSWAIQIKSKEIQDMIQAAGGKEYDPAQAIAPEQ